MSSRTTAVTRRTSGGSCCRRLATARPCAGDVKLVKKDGLRARKRRFTSVVERPRPGSKSAGPGPSASSSSQQLADERALTDDVRLAICGEKVS
jgi:hypothetical protein